MSIVLKENEWAKEMVDTANLGKAPSETLRRVARYYLDMGMSKGKARDAIEKFLLRCDKDASLTRWNNALDYAVKIASKHEALDIDSIVITDNEMNTIDAISGKATRRLAFTLLCLSKYWDAYNKVDTHWVNSKTSEIMSMANINASTMKQGAMYHNLLDKGLITSSKSVSCVNVQVNFIQDGTPVMYIDDFRNLGFQYFMYHGEPYMKCQNCGITTKCRVAKSDAKLKIREQPDNKCHQKYCNECAIRVAIRHRVDSVMRYRESQKI